MAGEDKFSLRWNDFESSLSTSFQQFRGSLLDVEILCNSGAVVAAHRLVLCACSEVLREALLRVRYLFSFEIMIANDVMLCVVQATIVINQQWSCAGST